MLLSWPGEEYEESLLVGRSEIEGEVALPAGETVELEVTEATSLVDVVPLAVRDELSIITEVEGLDTVAIMEVELSPPDEVASGVTELDVRLITPGSLVKVKVFTLELAGGVTLLVSSVVEKIDLLELPCEG